MFLRRRSQNDFDAEIEAHLQLEAERLQEQGLTAEQARAAARRAFGNVTRARERFYESGRWLLWDDLVRDLRSSVRQLRKTPGFLTVALLTLALGVGANTAIFSVVNAVLLSPLPYAQSDRLVLVKEAFPQVDPAPFSVSAPDIATIRALNHVFDGVAAFRVWTYELSGAGEPERVVGDRASSNLFAVLGVRPKIGRSFTAEEERPGHPVVVISDGLWRRRFGGDPSVLGRTLQLDRKPYTIVGVMPQSFVFPLPGMAQGAEADLWVPLALTRSEMANVGDSFDFGVLARLRPGVGPKEVEADLKLVARGILETYARFAREAHVSLGDLRLAVVSLSLTDQVRGPVRPMLLILLGAVAFVLLIACVNVANLLLIRAAGRHKEMALRLALGAGRSRLFRQLLVEGMLLAITGAVSGLVVAVWLEKVLVSGLPADVPQFRAVALDLRVLFFTCGLTAATGIVFGALPALSLRRTDPNRWLKEGGRDASPGGEHRRVRAALVVLQVSTSLVLLVGAGLLLRSFNRVVDTNPGFRPDRVMTGSIDLPATAYRRYDQAAGFYRSVLERLRQTPGVLAAGGSTDLPLLGQWTHLFTPEGYRPLPGGSLNRCNHSVIYGDYLQAMGIPLLRGRYFGDDDRSDSTHVLIVSQALARKYWGGQDPVGKRLKWGPPEAEDIWMTVVGVAGDVKQGPLDAATSLHTYESYAQAAQPMSLRVAVRGQGDPDRLAADLRAAVSSVDKQIAIGRPSTMEQVIHRSTAGRRFNVLVLGAFAGVALALAALGIYGLVAYAVTRRTHEVGVRMALGARGTDVVALMLREGMPAIALGIVLGVAGALATTRVLQTSLYEIQPTDSATFVLALLLLAVTALGATCIPARRATRIEPVRALRHE